LADSLAALNNTPDVRTDLVAQLKAKIDAGEYEIPYDELAKKLAAVMKG
jgi:anti-sigma28 factor (negative regulator of flagellin synthesis)